MGVSDMAMRRQQRRPYVPTAAFLLGYLAVWITFSALATLAQWGLHDAALMSPTMASTSPILGGVLVLAAGIYQWTLLKHTCLRHCRSPLDFLTTEWREGTVGAIWMGRRHGSYCTGCCWLLMLLLFAVGVMNLFWVASVAFFVLLEKIAPWSEWISRVAGVLLVTGGAWIAAGGLL